MRLRILAVCVLLLIGLVGLLTFYYTQPKERLVIATTTSLSDTGLLEQLKSAFEKRNQGTEVLIIPRGTGLALEMGRRGDAGLVLVHNRALEEEFVRTGYGMHRVTVMYNDFIIVGPPRDPASAAGSSVTTALQRIANSGDDGKASFISRSDLSGTHLKEIELWQQAGFDPQGRSWYVKAATGMAKTLLLASEKQAYTLVDRGTWVSLASKLNLRIVVENEPPLLNPYSAILVNSERHPHVNTRAAERFILFLISDDGQKMIAQFRRDNITLFNPIFGLTEKVGLPPEPEAVQYWTARLQGTTRTGRTDFQEARLVQSLSTNEIVGVVLNTLFVSGSAVILATLVGVPIGATVGLRSFVGKRITLTMINALMGIPPVLVGLIVFLALSREGPLGLLDLLFKPEAMIIAQFIIVTPIITGITASSVQTVDRRVKDLALSLGASGRQLKYTILREAKPGFVTAITAGLARAVSEVGAILIVGGAIRITTWTLTVAIVEATEIVDFTGAIQLGVMLLAVSFTLNLILTQLQRGTVTWK